MFRESNHDETGGIPIPVKPDVSGGESGVYDVMLINQSPEEISLGNLLKDIEQEDGGLNPAVIYFNTDENLADGFREFKSRLLEVHRRSDEVFNFFKELSSKMPSKRSAEPIVDESLVAMQPLIPTKEMERIRLLTDLMELQKEGEHYRKLAEERYTDFRRAVAALEIDILNIEKQMKDNEYILARIKKQYGKEYKELDEMLKHKKGREMEIKVAWEKMAGNIENVKSEMFKEWKTIKSEADVFKRKLLLVEKTVRVMEIYQNLDEIKLKKLQEIV